MDGGTSTVVGREGELDALRAFLDGRGARVLLLEGEAGIGKTALWRLGVDEARAHGFRVLACAAAESETQLAFTGLRDLIGEAFDEVAGELPPPQRHALDVVLLRDDPGAQPPGAGTAAVAFLTTLRLLSARAPLLLAVDDTQWLDGASAAALQYVLRRLEAAPVSVLLARRAGESDGLALDRLAPDRALVLEVGPVSMGALGRILHARAGATYPRPTLKRVHDVSGGNPFFGLELARTLDASARPLAPGAALPVPRTLNELVRNRLTALPAGTLEALLVAAASARPTLSVVEAALGSDAATRLDPAIESHVASVEGDGIRFAHPLFAAAAYELATAARRREVHARLAELADDVEERARHLALSTDAPDEDVAAALEEAARRTRRRGDRVVCAELFEAAARLTPDEEAPARARRRLGEATALFEAGDSAQARAVLESLLAALDGGSERTEAEWRLGVVLAETDGDERAMQLWRSALAATDDPGRASDVRRSMAVTHVYAGDGDAAIEQAGEAVSAAEASGDDERLAYALAVRALAGAIAGQPFAAFVDRALTLESSMEAPCSAWSPRAVAAECARLTLDVDAAEREFDVVHEQAVETGNAEMEQWSAYGLASTRLAAGDHDAAQALVRVVVELAETTGVMRLPAARLQAELDAHLGLADDARARLVAVRAEAEERGLLRYAWQARAATGALELAAGDAAAAADELLAARELAESSRIRHVAALVPIADEVEAAALAGRRDQAADALAAARAFDVGLAWADAALLRGEAAVRALDDDTDGAEAALAEALGRDPFALGRARTLLALGSLQRRLLRRRDARETLQQALDAFEELDARLWADRAREEVARIGGRPPSDGGLTPSERRIARLVAEGRTNKEVAAALVVAERTVESTLTQVYRKLDVRSRTELARRLTEDV
jgi:DNA-binding CsgD family transcriptional regulator/tetratricopeptide (TPR) repeat protein